MHSNRNRRRVRALLLGTTVVTGVVGGGVALSGALSSPAPPSVDQMAEEVRSTEWVPIGSDVAVLTSEQRLDRGLPAVGLGVNVTVRAADSAEAITTAWRALHAAVVPARDHDAPALIRVKAYTTSGVLADEYQEYVKLDVVGRLSALESVPLDMTRLRASISPSSELRLRKAESGPLGATVVDVETVVRTSPNAAFQEAGPSLSALIGAIASEGRPYLVRLLDADGKVLGIHGYSHAFGQPEQDGVGVTWLAQGVEGEPAGGPLFDANR